MGKSVEVLETYTFPHGATLTMASTVWGVGASNPSYEITIELSNRNLWQYKMSFNSKEVTQISYLLWNLYKTAYFHVIPPQNIYNLTALVTFYQNDTCTEILESDLTDLEKGFALLLHSAVGEFKPIQFETAREHSQRVQGLTLTTPEEVSYFINPFAAQFGPDFYTFMLRLWNIERRNDQLEDLYKSPYREFIYRLWIANFTKQNSETSLKNIDLVPPSFNTVIEKLDEETFDFLELPLTHVNYRSYLLEKPVADVIFLLETLVSIPRVEELGANSIITLSDQMLGIRNQTLANGLLSQAVVTSGVIMEKLHKLNDVQLLTEWHQALLSEPWRHQTFAFAIDYFEETPFEEITAESALEIERILWNKGVDKWLQEPPLADYVIGRLKKVLTPAEVLTVIDTVAKETPLTVTQWESFTNNSNEFKDLPVSWWLTLVTSNREIKE
jgi:hypothetical protein